MKNTHYILGISAYYHDSAAALLKNGQIVAAAQEERFSRIKHDASFPAHAIAYCLQAADIGIDDVDDLVFYDKPLLKFERLLETYLANVPRGFRSFVKAMPVWLKEKLYLKKILRDQLSQLAGKTMARMPTLKFAQHHQSHAASAFYPSPFDKALVLCVDGVGEWATTTLWQGEGTNLQPLWEIKFPHSLGLLYSAFTYYCGFKVNSGEYKLMGLAPYGQPKYQQLILEHLIDVKDDGSFRLNMDYFNYEVGLSMTNRRFHQLFAGPPRKPETEITQKEMDIARSIQTVTEMIMLKMVSHIHNRYPGNDNLCLAGGVALNCVSNGLIQRRGPFKNIWIQPAAGDAGGAPGCALALWHQHYQQPRPALPAHASDRMSGSYLGPAFDNQQISQYLDQTSAVYHQIEDPQLFTLLAQAIDQGKVIGWFQGRMEFGPRALGARSIIGDPRNPNMQTTMNLKIKYRESFRPFAPSVLAENVSTYFDFEGSSPYMLMVAPLAQAQLCPTGQKLSGLEMLRQVRSRLPAITHVDNSARIQTVHQTTNPRYYQLIKAFAALTGCPVVINTSFNVRGEPIVCTPKDAWQCFMRTEMDILVMENIVLYKNEQKPIANDSDWQNEFQLD